MHLLMTAHALAAYLDHNKHFDIYSNASNFQLGASIMQEGRPLAYLLKKVKMTTKLYNNGKGAAFHCCYS